MKVLSRYIPASFVLFFFIQAFSTSAQEVEFGIWGGGTSSFGDINHTAKSLQFTRPGGGVFYRYNFDDRWAWKVFGNFGMTQGADSVSNNPYKSARNLSFRTNIYEVGTHFEFNFFQYEPGHKKHFFTPYIFMGVSLFYFNPQAQLEGEWHNLQPLGTEGQQFPELTGNDPYKRVQLGIPIGGGVKYSLSKHWTLGLEFSYRQLFTDYLDDVSSVYADRSIIEDGENGDIAVQLADRSTEVDIIPIGEEGKQRGDSKRKDAFLFSGISLSYSIQHYKCPPPGNSSSKSKKLLRW